jgi:hypothetical protein
MPLESAPRNHTLPPLVLGQFIVEIVIIVVVLISAGGYLFNLDQSIQFGGVDYGLLTHKGGFASNIFRLTGRISLWDPFIGNGEPMLESLQSFVLNPLVIFPYLIWETPNSVKVSVFLHMFIAGLGGWALGRVVGLRSVGRVLLAILLSCNGSMTGPFSRGVYELAVSQAYIPWVLAGIIGVVYLRSRLYIGLFAIATMLFVFCGTFWYVLPMAFVCGLIVLLALFIKDSQTRQLVVHLPTLYRVLIAGGLLVGLLMIRILPLDRTLVYHPETGEDRTSTFVDTAARYFAPVPVGVPFDYYWKEFHYIFSFSLLVVLLVLRVALWRYAPNRLPGGWPLPVCATLCIVAFTALAQGPTEPLKALYEAIPPLKDWRNTARMGVMVTTWLALTAAVCLDAIVGCLWTMQAHITAITWRRVAIFAAMSGLIVWSALAVADVTRNWRRMVSFVPAGTVGYAEPLGLRYLRDRFPHQFLNVINREWLVHFGFNHTMTRFAYGDAHVFTVGMPSTIGGYIDFKPEFAVSTVGFEPMARYRGYLPFADVEAPTGIGPAAWYHPYTYPYAFVTKEINLFDPRQAMAVSYWHQIDQIILTARNFAADSVLVAQETAYPGWVATINGQPARLESIGGRLGVRLPNELATGSAEIPVTVIFSYRPPKVYLGGFVTVLAALLTMGYLLRLDQSTLGQRVLITFRHRFAPHWQAFKALYTKEL